MKRRLQVLNLIHGELQRSYYRRHRRSSGFNDAYSDYSVRIISQLLTPASGLASALGRICSRNSFCPFPDVDTNSKAQDIFFLLAFVVDLVLIYYDDFAAAAYLGLIAMLPILGHHRGWTHRLWAAIIVPLPILIGPILYNPDNWSVGAIYYAAAVSGYLSHLLLDGLIWKKIRFKG